MKNHRKILQEEERENNLSFWWLSFCDTDKPKGSQFKGVIIVKAIGIAHAIEKTNELEINPHGEILFVELGVDENIPDVACNKLLNKEALKTHGFIS